MSNAIIFDCEFLTAEGAQSRFWCGPYDPDPIVVQIGLVKLDLESDHDILDTKQIYVTPKDRYGNSIALDPFFTSLTGISDQDIRQNGIPLEQALVEIAEFRDGSKLWSWGKDELNMLAISCFIAGIAPSIPPTQFGNACNLLLKSGMPYDDLKRTSSGRLADYYQINHPALRQHDALDDARSIAFVLQYLLNSAKLAASDFL